MPFTRTNMESALSRLHQSVSLERAVKSAAPLRLRHCRTSGTGPCHAPGRMRRWADAVSGAAVADVSAIPVWELHPVATVVWNLAGGVHHVGENSLEILESLRRDDDSLVACARFLAECQESPMRVLLERNDQRPLPCLHFLGQQDFPGNVGFHRFWSGKRSPAKREWSFV